MGEGREREREGGREGGNGRRGCYDSLRLVGMRDTPFTRCHLREPTST